MRAQPGIFSARSNTRAGLFDLMGSENISV